jgi:Bacterial Ig-like domain (group 3)/FG-GAP-like repeat
MTRKLTRKTSALRGIAPFIAILIVMLALAALAQTRSEPRANPSVTSTRLDASSLSLPEVANLAHITGRWWPSAGINSGAIIAPQTPQTLFLPAVAYNSGAYGPDAVVIADINGDGRPDMLVADECVDLNDCNTLGGVVAVLLGNGDGTFQPAATYRSGGSHSSSLAVADVNGDGRPDVVVANESCAPPNCTNKDHGWVGVLLGNGDGTFQPAVTYGSGGEDALSVAVADVNGDHKPDIVVANDCTSLGCSPDARGLVGVLLGNGDGTFQPAVSYASGGDGATSIAVTDVNGDGKPDLLVANLCVDCQNDSTGVVGVLLGNGNGTFQQAIMYKSGGGGGQALAVADVNSDSNPDLVVVNYFSNTVGVLLSNGDGTFQQALTYGSGGPYPQAVAVADVNDDGKPDLLLANQCQSGTCGYRGLVGVLLGNGDGTFQKALIYHSAGTGTAAGLAAADLNNDGKPDVLVTNGCVSTTNCATGAVSVLLDNPGPFTTKTVVTTSGSPSFVGQSVTFTATVKWTYGTVPDGELVTFYDGTTAIGTGSTASGVATFTTSSLAAKTHYIKATYAGDAKFMPSSGTVKQVVEKYPTTTSLTSSLNPSHFGQAVTFTAHVTSSGPAPTGSVKFLDGTLAIGSKTLSGGEAKLTKSNLAIGTHSITAHYNGDAASSTSTSAVVNQVVQ